jgi:hypothetical protein
MDVSGRGRAGIARRALQQRLLSLLETLPDVQVQNRLMACTDRDLALCLLGIDAPRVHEALGLISSRKSARVLSELALEERRHVADVHIVMSLERVIESLTGSRPLPGTRSYIRPRRNNGGA